MILGTSYKGHDAGKYSGWSLLLEQIFFEIRDNRLFKVVLWLLKKVTLEKKKGFSRHVQSIFAKTGSYPVELSILKYRVKPLLSLLFLPAKVVLVISATLHHKIVVNLNILYSLQSVYTC